MSDSQRTKLIEKANEDYSRGVISFEEYQDRLNDIDEAYENDEELDDE